MTPSAGPRLRIRLGLGLAALAMIAAPTVVPAAAAAESAGPLAPVSLRCEYLVNPMGIDMAKPRFFWVDRAHGARPGPVGLSDRRLDRPQGRRGRHLGQRQDRLPQVRSRSPSPGRRSRAASPISGRSAPGTGTAARAPGAPWRASTPGSSTRATGRASGSATKNQLRKEFSLKGRVKRARAYIAGLGYYELRINGRKAGNHVLDPAWTTYDKRVLYATYDVTSLAPRRSQRRRRHARQRLVQVAGPPSPAQHRARGRQRR